jgi:non-ribosomal peptide synthetase-like protein
VRRLAARPVSGWSALAIWIFVTGIQWTYAAMPDPSEVYLRTVEFALGLFVIFSALPIVAKWLLIGKFKPQAIPIWSLRYFRFWAIKALIRSAPMAAFGGPLYNLYLRLLGAKIGAKSVIHSQLIPVCTDLISIGPNTILRQDLDRPRVQGAVELHSYRADRHRRHVFIGEASVIDINTAWRTAASSATRRRCTAGSAFRRASAITARRRARPRPTIARSSRCAARRCGAACTPW